MATVGAMANAAAASAKPKPPGGGGTTPSTTITVDPTSSSTSPAIQYGYDVKEGDKAANFDSGLINSYFGSGGPFSVLRIPIYAGDGVGDNGEPDSSSPGDINTALYAPIVQAAKNVMAVHPGVKIYANLKSPSSGSTFAPWVQGANFPSNYATLLFNVVAYMQSQSVTIDDVGILNELSASQLSSYAGGMSAVQAYGQTVRDLKALISGTANPYNHNPVAAVPTYLAPDSYEPHNSLVSQLDSAGLGDTANVESTHFYSKSLSTEAAELPNFVTWASGRPMWQTEFHWSQGPNFEHGYAEVRDAVFSAFSNFAYGLDTLTWWNYSDDTSADPDIPTQAAIQQEFATSSAGLRYLATPSETGTSNALASGALVSRAFAGTTASGSHVVRVWIINDSSSAQTNLVIQGSAATAATGSSWAADSGGTLSTSPTALGASVNATSKTVTIATLPAHSVTSVRITS